MEFVQYSLSALVAFSGVPLGAFLALTAKEEMPTGRKYFPWLQKIILMAVVALLLNHFNALLMVKAAAYAALLFVLLRSNVFNFYPFLAAAFFILGQNSRELFAIAVLVFLYGFPTGSMFVIKNKRVPLLETLGRASLRYAVLPVAAILLQLVYALI